jgi:hypothetical protein
MTTRDSRPRTSPNESSPAFGEWRGLPLGNEALLCALRVIRRNKSSQIKKSDEPT